MKYIAGTLIFLVSGLSLSAQELDAFGCHASLSNEQLVLENSLITRTFQWNHGDLRTLSMTDKTGGYTWQFKDPSPDMLIPGVEPSGEGEIEFRKVDGDNLVHEHLEIAVVSEFENLWVKRVFKVFPDCPAIACDLYMKGSHQGAWTHEDNRGRITTPVFEKVSPEGVHWRNRVIAFSDRTDDNNNLVTESEYLIYTRALPTKGNLVFAEPEFGSRALFILKESPNAEAQIGYPGCDFLVLQSQDHYLSLMVTGLNLSPGDLDEEQWVRCSGFVTGVTSTSGFDQMNDLRSYQEKIRVWDPARDEMILMNTWGDRGQDSNINEQFCLQEIRAARELWLTHFQLDDGWQNGLTSNSAQEGGSLDGIWEKDNFWEVHPQRFPNGLSPVVKEAAGKDIKLGLWFNPSHDHHYANWRNDARTILNYYREYGISVYKIDGVKIDSKQAEMNFRSFLDTLMYESGGEIVINLDVTGLDRRPGYHFFNEYGNIFLENRYTDWGNYYPHWTLRNLWDLSAWMPAQKLQIEFLNPWRNTGKYLKNDPLSPSGIPFDYQFAITMMAQPLAWFEGSKLPIGVIRVVPVIHQYREVMQDVHSGRIFPIGFEPSGLGWTGFQSVKSEKSGYMLVFREYHPETSMLLDTHCGNGKKIQFEHVVGNGKSFVTTSDEKGRVEFTLPARWNYALYKYTLE